MQTDKYSPAPLGFFWGGVVNFYGARFFQKFTLIIALKKYCHLSLNCLQGSFWFLGTEDYALFMFLKYNPQNCENLALILILKHHGSIKKWWVDLSKFISHTKKIKMLDINSYIAANYEDICLYWCLQGVTFLR